MKRNLFLVAMLATVFLATSCGSWKKKKKTDDDFYDFEKQNPRTEQTTHTTHTPHTTYDANHNTEHNTNHSEGTYTGTYEDASEGSYTKHSPVSSRMEKVEIVRGAIDYEAKYFIILGSFSQEANANKLVGRLAQQGFAPNILRSPTGMYRVSGFYFNDEDAARLEVAEIRKKYPEYSDLWLLIKK